MEYAIGIQSTVSLPYISPYGDLLTKPYIPHHTLDANHTREHSILPSSQGTSHVEANHVNIYISEFHNSLYLDLER